MFYTFIENYKYVPLWKCNFAKHIYATKDQKWTKYTLSTSMTLTVLLPPFHTILYTGEKENKPNKDLWIVYIEKCSKKCYINCFLFHFITFYSVALQIFFQIYIYSLNHKHICTYFCNHRHKSDKAADFGNSLFLDNCLENNIFAVLWLLIAKQCCHGQWGLFMNTVHEQLWILLKQFLYGALYVQMLDGQISMDKNVLNAYELNHIIVWIVNYLLGSQYTFIF